MILMSRQYGEEEQHEHDRRTKHVIYVFFLKLEVHEIRDYVIRFNEGDTKRCRKYEYFLPNNLVLFKGVSANSGPKTETTNNPSNIK